MKRSLGVLLGTLVLAQGGWAVWTSAAGLPSQLTNISIDKGTLQRLDPYTAQLYAHVRFHLANGTSFNRTGLNQPQYFLIRGKLAVEPPISRRPSIQVAYMPQLPGPKYATKTDGPSVSRTTTLEDLDVILTNNARVSCPPPPRSVSFYYGCVDAQAWVDMKHRHPGFNLVRTTRFDIGRLHARQEVYCTPSGNCGPEFYSTIYETP